MRKADQIKRYTAHFGAIVFNYAICAFIITILLASSVVLIPLLVGISGILVVLYYFFLIIATVLTFGTLLLSEEFRTLFGSGALEWAESLSGTSGEIITKMIEMVPYLGIITVSLCIISLICLLMDRNWKYSKYRIITLGIIALITIAIAIMAVLGFLVVIGGIIQ